MKLIIILLAGALALGGVERVGLVEQNTRYAAIIAAAANSGSFAIGEGWLVSCQGKKVAVY